MPVLLAQGGARVCEDVEHKADGMEEIGLARAVSTHCKYIWNLIRVDMGKADVRQGRDAADWSWLGKADRFQHPRGLASGIPHL